MTKENNKKNEQNRSWPVGWITFLRLHMKLVHEKTKKSIFSQGLHIFQNFFFLKYFLVDKLTIAKKKI